MNVEKGKLREIIINALSRIPLFSGLPAEALQRLIQYSGLSRFEKGTVIIEEGEAGDRAFIVASGKVKIYKGDPEKETVLRVAGPSEVIGEMSLFFGVL